MRRSGRIGGTTYGNGRLHPVLRGPGRCAWYKIRANLASVFDVFAQNRATLHHAQGGLGLGLAIVRRLVTLHDGSVRVESEGAGRGSAFT